MSEQFINALKERRADVIKQVMETITKTFPQMEEDGLTESFRNIVTHSVDLGVGFTIDTFETHYDSLVTADTEDNVDVVLSLPKGLAAIYFDEVNT